MNNTWAAKFAMNVEFNGEPNYFETNTSANTQAELLDSIVEEVYSLYQNIEEKHSELIDLRGIFKLEAVAPDGGTSYSQGPMNVKEIVHYTAMHRLTIVYSYQHIQLRQTPAVADLIRGSDYRPFLLPDMRILDDLRNVDLVHEDFSAVRAMSAIDKAVARLRSA